MKKALVFLVAIIVMASSCASNKKMANLIQTQTVGSKFRVPLEELYKSAMLPTMVVSDSTTATYYFYNGEKYVVETSYANKFFTTTRIMLNGTVMLVGDNIKIIDPKMYNGDIIFYIKTKTGQSLAKL